ncbi:hypothetical protein [Tabrizicola sp.]|uniref:hypothetical protein n=1 Tax=Tabrizicola sp. TaxID=2005166 RepID=UPI0035B24CB0
MRPSRANAKCLAASALADLDRARRSVELLSSELEGGVKAAFNDPLNTGTDLAAWRAAHRSGTPSKLDTDAELRAFVLNLIETLTYDQIVQAVEAAFPPDQRTSRSSLSRWFRRQREPRAGVSIG